MEARRRRLPRNEGGRMEVKTGPRNFIANPPKRGGWGTTGTLLGEGLKNTSGVGDEAVKSVFKYVSSEYDAPAEAARKERAAARAKLAGRKPFTGTVSRALHRKDLPIVEDVFLAGGEVDDSTLQGRAHLPAVPPAAVAREDRTPLYTPSPAGSPAGGRGRKRPGTAPALSAKARERRAKAAEALASRPPFRAAAPATKGPLGEYPKHIPDPVPERVYVARGREAKVFKPTSVPRSRFTSSVMLKGTNLARHGGRARPSTASIGAMQYRHAWQASSARSGGGAS